MRDFEKEDPDLTSLLRWVILAGLLLWLGMTVASSAPPPPVEVQVGTAAGAPGVTMDGDDETDEGLEDDPAVGRVQCYVPGTIVPVSKNVNYACYQEGAVGSIDRFQHVDNPGFLYTVRESDGIISITPTPLQTLEGSGCFEVAVRPRCVFEGRTALASVSTAPAQSRFCIGEGEENCTDTSTLKGELDVEAERNEGIPRVIAEADEPNDLIQQHLSDVDSAILGGAFDDHIDTINASITSNETTIDKIDGLIEGLCGGQDCSDGSTDWERQQTLLAQRAELERRNRDLENQRQVLADAQVRLGSGDPSAGTPNSRPVRDDNPVYTPPGNPTTFGDPRDPQVIPGSPPPEEEGGFGAFIRGFFESLFGGGSDVPPTGNQTPQPAGTCTSALLCDGNLLYQRNTQCVDTPVEQCQYGCDTTRTDRCASPPGVCDAEPNQPNVSNCPNGTWTPVKNANGCTTSWLCTALTRPTATLSCQPRIADAGMTLSISYSCSTGTSVGGGFSTGGAALGATTTVLARPPAGMNIATFSLTCTNQGLATTTTCDVQVAKPAIVLVANPQSVEENETSIIGWVTSGMEKCTISSPDQSDFTARNAASTSVNGVASTSPITIETDILLRCTTVGGNTREASTTISVL